MTRGMFLTWRSHRKRPARSGPSPGGLRPRRLRGIASSRWSRSPSGHPWLHRLSLIRSRRPDQIPGFPPRTKQNRTISRLTCDLISGNETILIPKGSSDHHISIGDGCSLELVGNDITLSSQFKTSSIKINDLPIFHFLPRLTKEIAKKV